MYLPMSESTFSFDPETGFAARSASVSLRLLIIEVYHQRLGLSTLGTENLGSPTADLALGTSHPL